MKRVFSTWDRSLAQLLRGALEAADIPATVEGDHLSPLQGELPAGTSAQLHVSILDDEQEPRARIFVDEWRRQREQERSGQTWTCAGCGETHEAQFSACWNCGAESSSG